MKNEKKTKMQKIKIKIKSTVNDLDITSLFVIAQGCEQTLGLGLEQSKDIVVVFY